MASNQRNAPPPNPHMNEIWPNGDPVAGIVLGAICLFIYYLYEVCSKRLSAYFAQRARQRWEDETQINDRDFLMRFSPATYLSTTSFGVTSASPSIALLGGEVVDDANLSNTSLGMPSADPSSASLRDENVETDMCTCSICSHCYNDRERRPLVLPCSHSFCQSCLKQMVARANKTCPNCRKTWKAKKVSELLCCYQLIPGTSAVRKVVTRCSLHKMALSCWCESCTAALCIKCVQMNHMTCSWMAIDEKEDIIKSSGEQAYAKLKTAAAGIQDLLMCLEDIRLREGKLMSWQHQAEIQLAGYRSLTNEVLEQTDLYKLQHLATVIKQIETLTEDAPMDPLLIRVANACKNP